MKADSRLRRRFWTLGGFAMWDGSFVRVYRVRRHGSDTTAVREADPRGAPSALFALQAWGTYLTVFFSFCRRPRRLYLTARYQQTCFNYEVISF